jgi:hypothetical protein
VSPSRLVGALPQWEYTDHNGDPVDEPREVLIGKLRIVHRQRARTLRRRGEHLIDLRRSFPKDGFKACYGWVVEPPALEAPSARVVSV